MAKVKYKDVNFRADSRDLRAATEELMSRERPPPPWVR
jgi:hypothetical protein